MPAYTKKQQLINALTERIESGEYPPGAKLPSGTELCEEFNVSRQVVRAAIDWLKARGLVEGAPGAGVFVRERDGQQLARLTDLVNRTETDRSAVSWQPTPEQRTLPHSPAVRAESIATHAVTFYALGAAGRRLFSERDGDHDWADPLKKLGDLDWSKTNAEWQGICMIGPDTITRRQTRSALADQLSWKLGITDAKPERVLEPS